MNPFHVKGDKRFLVIARVGDSSLHPEWLKPAKYKNFDLCLSYFNSQPGRFSEDCDFYHETPGVKWPILKDIIALFGEQIEHYDAIWLPDDDISTNAFDINRMFELFMQYKLELAQPALTKDSYYSHKITRVNPEYSLRYSQFVEPMVPIFSKQAFRTLWPTFEKSQAAYGLDFVWPKVLGYPHKKIGIIDEVPMKHTRPVGGGTLYQNITTNRWDDFHRVTKEYEVEVKWNPVHYDGVPKKKKVMFALLAHHEENVLAAQLDNIRHYNPNAGIVVYNGGLDPDFASNLNVTLCPYSRPIRSENAAPFMLDVMKWLDENKVEYEYLVNLDNQMLFVKHGYEDFLDQTMKYSDCMGWDLQKISSEEEADNDSKSSMWKERKKWSSMLGNNGFLRFYFPAQVYRYDMVKQMLSSIFDAGADRKIAESEVQGFEEFFFVTLAESLKGRCREYPQDRILNVMNSEDEVDLVKVQKAMIHPYFYFVRPMKGERLIEMNRWLTAGGTVHEDPAQHGGTAEKDQKRKRTKVRKRKWRQKIVSGRKKVKGIRKGLRYQKRRSVRRMMRKTFTKTIRKTTGKTVRRTVLLQRRQINKRRFKSKAGQFKRFSYRNVENPVRTVWKNTQRTVQTRKQKKAA